MIRFFGLISQTMNTSATLALALREIDGVGRVTTRKLLRSFPSYASLKECPFEQLLNRMKGVSHAQRIAKDLLSEEQMEPRLTRARESIEALTEKGVHVLTARHDAWPAGVNDLPRKYQPDVLYAYGPLDAFSKKRVALLGSDALDAEPFEAAQSLVKALADYDAVPVSGAKHGFDVVISKRASAFRMQGSVMVSHAGLSRVPTSFRPVASKSVRMGGVLLSPFKMDHGPFDHDDVERALLQAAVADCSVFFAAESGSPEAHALQWAASAGRSVFVWRGLDEEAEGTTEVAPSTLQTAVLHELSE